MDRIDAVTRSRVMSRVRSKRTGLESEMELLLRSAGVRRISRNMRSLPGTPDFVIRSARLTIFVDSCFWHGCRWHCRRPSSRTDYWNAKIDRNARRDRDVTRLLRLQGWQVIRVWEHQLADPGKRAIAENRIRTVVMSGPRIAARP
jgi:DNA mismatch endonuclease (patch repair protein)